MQGLQQTLSYGNCSSGALGSQYEVPEFNYLSVWIEESFGLIEITLGSEKEINVYLNDCTFDDLSTSVVHFQSG